MVMAACANALELVVEAALMVTVFPAGTELGAV
jgi:hypothetical protein